MVEEKNQLIEDLVDIMNMKLYCYEVFETELIGRE